MAVSPWLGAAWVHEFQPSWPVTALLTAAPGTIFTSEFSARSQTYSGTGGLSVAW
jgi:hypothetical protein